MIYSLFQPGCAQLFSDLVAFWVIVILTKLILTGIYFKKFFLCYWFEKIQNIISEKANVHCKLTKREKEQKI